MVFQCPLRLRPEPQQAPEIPEEPGHLARRADGDEPARPVRRHARHQPERRAGERGPAEGMAAEMVEAAEALPGRIDRPHRHRQRQGAPPRGTVTRQVERDDLMAGGDQLFRQCRKIGCPRAPAVHHQHTAGEGRAGPRGKTVRDGRAAGKGKRHALGLPHPAFGAGKQLPLLHTGRPAARRRRKEAEGGAPGRIRGNRRQAGKREPDDLQAKGCHSGNPEKCSMLNNKVQP